MERRRSTGPRRTPANLVPSASLCCAVTHMNFAVIATDLMCRHGSFSGLSEWHRRCGLIGLWLCENSEQMVASANPRPPPFACDLPCFGNPWHTAFNKRLGCRHYVVARAAVVLRREPVDAVQPRIAGRLQMVDVQSQPSGEDLNRSGRKVASANPRPPPFACDLPCFGNPWHTAFNKRLGCRHYVVARAAVVLRREPVDAVQPRIAGRLQMVDVQSQPSGEIGRAH